MTIDARPAALAVLGICNWVAWWSDPAGRSDPAAAGAAMADLAVAMVAQTGPPGPPQSPEAALAAARRDLDQLERLLADDHDHDS